jgi:hypothetical protein
VDELLDVPADLALALEELSDDSLLLLCNGKWVENQGST